MVIENRSGLKPLGAAVLCVPYMPELDTEIAVPDHVRAVELMREMRGIVLQIGTCCWKGEPEPRCKVGDKVLISRFSGTIAKGPLDGKLYRLCNDQDIFCGLEDEADLKSVIIEQPGKARGIDPEPARILRGKL
jgi:co-chaperonin GroES (HSP10)